MSGERISRERRLTGWFVLVVGGVGILAGLRVLVLDQSPIARGLGCKAFCGWVMIVETLFGSTVGSVVHGALVLVAGAVLARIGYALLWSKAR